MTRPLLLVVLAYVLAGASTSFAMALALRRAQLEGAAGGARWLRILPYAVLDVALTGLLVAYLVLRA